MYIFTKVDVRSIVKLWGEGGSESVYIKQSEEGGGGEGISE